MSQRFEVLTMTEGRCLFRFHDCADVVLIASTALSELDLAERTIDWLRAALQKDWLYRIGRAHQGGGPTFTLRAPLGVVCASPVFSSSDTMERAVITLKKAAPNAPIVLYPYLTDPQLRVPGSLRPAKAVKPSRTLSQTPLTYDWAAI